MVPPIAFSTLACPTWGWREIVELGPEYGYDGVEIRMLAGDTDLLSRPEFHPAERALRRRELDAAGFRVCGLASSVRLDSTNPAHRQQQLETGQGYFELARDLGARFVRVFGDLVPPADRPDERLAALDWIALGLEQLGELAGPLGVDVLIETHGDFADSRLMAGLLERVSSPHVGVLWDTHHPWRFCGETLSETWTRLAPRNRHTHWKDSLTLVPREQSAEEIAAEEQAKALMGGHRPASYVPFGEGEFPAAETMRILQQSGYDGWLSYEWEKAWHPEIDPPEIALPLFPLKVRQLWGQNG